MLVAGELLALRRVSVKSLGSLNLHGEMGDLYLSRGQVQCLFNTWKLCGTFVKGAGNQTHSRDLRACREL